MLALKRELVTLQLPMKPQGPFEIYLQKLKSSNGLSLPNLNFIYQGESESKVKMMWYNESIETHAYFEALANTLQRRYQVEYDTMSQRSESIREEIDLIIARSDLEAFAVKKKISPFRVFKREIASLTKLEFPNMRSQERQLIVKAKWQGISDSEKLLFVVKARLEEETSLHQRVQEFYRKRIEFAQAQCPLPDLKSLLRDYTIPHSIESTFVADTRLDLTKNSSDSLSFDLHAIKKGECQSLSLDFLNATSTTTTDIIIAHPLSSTSTSQKAEDGSSVESSPMRTLMDDRKLCIGMEKFPFNYSEKRLMSDEDLSRDAATL